MSISCYISHDMYVVHDSIMIKFIRVVPMTQ